MLPGVVLRLAIEAAGSAVPAPYRPTHTRHGASVLILRMLLPGRSRRRGTSLPLVLRAVWY